VTGKADYQEAIALSGVTYQLLSAVGPGMAGLVAAFVGIRQVFFLDAIQYTLPQGRVKIQLSHRQNDAIVLIRDTGIGIDKDDLPYLFDRFYRVKDDRSRESGGVGLGLAIARAIAIAHRGQISVQSQRGVGSSFTVKLPLRTPFSK